MIEKLVSFFIQKMHMLNFPVRVEEIYKKNFWIRQISFKFCVFIVHHLNIKRLINSYTGSLKL